MSDRELLLWRIVHLTLMAIMVGVYVVLVTK